MTRLDQAVDLAFRAHDGQTDKAGVPYIQHPVRVMARVLADGAGTDVACVAVLHDVIEDTNVSWFEVGAILSDDSLAALDVLTHTDG